MELCYLIIWLMSMSTGVPIKDLDIGYWIYMNILTVQLYLQIFIWSYSLCGIEILKYDNLVQHSDHIWILDSLVGHSYLHLNNWIFVTILTVVWLADHSAKRITTFCNLITGQVVVSIGLFWFCLLSFLYNGVYFLRFIFNPTLAKNLNANSFWATFLSAELRCHY